MPLPDTINDYVKQVCQQIRWRKAHARITQEMANHVIDTRDAYIKQGLDEQTATQKSINETGDALEIGTQLDRIHRPKPQWGMFLWVAGFFLLGVMLSYVLFPGMDFSYGGPLFRLVWLVIGTVFMAAAYFVDFSILGKYPRQCFIVLFIFVMAVVVYFFNSQHVEWLRIPYLGIIYVRYVTLLFPILLVPVIYNARNKGFIGLVSCLLVYSVLLFITIFTPSWMSGFVHFVPVGFALLVFATARGWFGICKLKGTLGVVVPHVALFSFWSWLLIQNSHGRNLMLDLLNPHRVPYTRGFQPLQIRRLLNSATLLGEGTPDYGGFWPMRDMPHTLYEDFLLATVTFRFGWLASAVVVGAFIFFIALAIQCCRRQKSALGFFVSMAVIMTFAMQVFTYVFTNFGFGMMRTSLPFISSNNASIVVNMTLIGLMLSVFRTGDAVADQQITVKQSNRISWQEGKLIINFNRKQNKTDVGHGE